MIKRVAIFASGGGSNAAALLASMTGDHPARACVVFANDPEAGVLEKAQAFEVPTEVLDHKPFKSDRAAFEAEVQKTVAAYEPDLICLAGFMRVLTAGFVANWEGRMLNIHPSLLPKYQGLNTHARALEAGDTEHGCTVHEVTDELDAGPILGQAVVPVEQGDTPESLAARVLEQEHILYPAVLRRFVTGDRTPVHITARG